ncbi:MAG: radical SAM protein, partial [bacterium]|nr:radical SAM protein [bacterium]
MQNILNQSILWHSPERKRERNCRLNQQESRAQKTRVRSYPIRGYLETTNRCNLRCQMCGQSLFEGDRTDLSDEIIQKLRPLFPYFNELSIFGFGEALVDKRFFNILAMIPDYVSTRLVTNGVLLDEKVARGLIQHQLKQLYISIEATNEDTYAFVRGGRFFNKVIGNIDRLMQMKKKENVQFPEIAFAFTFMKRTAGEFIEFMELAARLGIKIITGDYLIVYRPELIEESLFFEQEYADSIFEQAKEKAKSLGIELRIPLSFAEATKPTQSGQTDWRICYEPWEFIYFRSDGFVSPCCANDVKLGDLRAAPFSEVWNSQTYQEFRRTLNTTRPHPHCQSCINTGKLIITQREYHIKLL